MAGGRSTDRRKALPEGVLCCNPNDCAAAMKSLADPNRIRIVRALVDGPLDVGDIAGAAGLNPARDLAPRPAAWMLGWGRAAFPAHAADALWVYVAAPPGGATAASRAFTRIVEPRMRGASGPSASGRTVHGTRQPDCSHTKPPPPFVVTPTA